MKLSAAVGFSVKVNLIEYYHNCSWLEHGGAPEKATHNAFVSAVDAYIRKEGKYQKNESKITLPGRGGLPCAGDQLLFDSDILRNQTKKAITNRFIQEAMTEFFRANLEIYFIEHKTEADRIADQVLINKRTREQAEERQAEHREKAHR